MKPAAIAVAAIALAASATSANAATFLFSYQTSTGLIAGTFSGTLQADNNTVLLTSVSNLSFGGAAGPALPFVASFSNASGGSGLPALTTLDGSAHDFIACTDIVCGDGADGFGLTTGAGFGGPVYLGGSSFGPGLEAYDSQNWSASLENPVPEPASWAMLIAGFGLIGATMRRRRTAQPA